jgi:hypothetical protein
MLGLRSLPLLRSHRVPPAAHSYVQGRCGPPLPHAGGGGKALPHPRCHAAASRGVFIPTDSIARRLACRILPLAMRQVLPVCGKTARLYDRAYRHGAQPCREANEYTPVQRSPAKPCAVQPSHHALYHLLLPHSPTTWRSATPWCGSTPRSTTLWCMGRGPSRSAASSLLTNNAHPHLEPAREACAMSGPPCRRPRVSQPPVPAQHASRKRQLAPWCQIKVRFI